MLDATTSHLDKSLVSRSWFPAHAPERRTRRVLHKRSFLGLAPLQKCVGDFCCIIIVEGFAGGFPG